MTAQPNVLWIYGEDLYPDLACYGTPAVRTPHIDQLAAEGTTFRNAFVTCPVCSPSRSAIITGSYQTRIGAHHHRSRRDAPLPEDIPLITDCFRSAGYFTCNSPGPGAYDKVGKTDFNFAIDKPFDGTDWSQRAPGQPFYAQMNITDTHRDFVRDDQRPINPADVELPPYYPDHPDNTPALVDIGKSSPTGVVAGTHSHFPQKYRDAIYALDWTYGRILAIHLTPKGASYTGKPEVFLRGRPLNVTDATFGPDGAMYFVTGGRNTQSALYRVSYAVKSPPIPPQADPGASKLRLALRSLEKYHQKNAPALQLPEELDDPHIRHAARVAIEFQIMKGKSFTAKEVPDSALLALAKAHLGVTTTPSELPNVLDAETLRIHRINLPKFTQLHKEQLKAILLRHQAQDSADPWEYSALMVDLGIPEGTSRAMHLLQSSTTQRDRMNYLRLLVTAKTGWSPGLRRQFFGELANAKTYLGGRGLPTFLNKIRQDALATLSEKEKTSLGKLATESPAPQPPPVPDLSHRKFVRAWTMEDFAELKLPHQITNGTKLFDEGLCSRCHRFQNHGFPVGPDLTQVGSRLAPKDLLKAILEPSDSVAENYQTHVIQLHDGRELTGQIIPQADYRSRKLVLAPNPLEPTVTVEIPKGEMKSHRRSSSSFMPPSLLNTFSKEEVLALVAWLGNP